LPSLRDCDGAMVSRAVENFNWKIRKEVLKSVSERILQKTVFGRISIQSYRAHMCIVLASSRYTHILFTT
jgi:hypothetical protein